MFATVEANPWSVESFQNGSGNRKGCFLKRKTNEVFTFYKSLEWFAIIDSPITNSKKQTSKKNKQTNTELFFSWYFYLKFVKIWHVVVFKQPFSLFKCIWNLLEEQSAECSQIYPEWMMGK